MAFTVGGDHGGGKFRMTFKILFIFPSKPTISRLYQIGSVEFSKDDTKILKDTILDRVGEGLKEIVLGEHFIITMTEDAKLSVSFYPLGNDLDRLVCDVPTTLVVVGDLKFYSQVLGKENMSSCWCCWCTTHPSQWKTLHTAENRNKEEDMWTIEKLKQYKERIDRGELKEARDIKGVVDSPIWDFIEPSNFMFRQLHIEIGLMNNVLDNIYDFVAEQVEKATPEQKVAQNKVIMAEVAWTRSKERLDQWKTHGSVDLAMYRLEKSHLTASLR